MRKHLVAVAIVAAVASQPARAERPSDRVWIDAGGFLAKIDSNLRIDHVGLAVGTNVDFERHLGLDHSRVLPKASAGVRLWNRFRLEADYFSLNRNARISLHETIRIDDTVFPANAEVHSEFDTDVYRVAVGYSFIRRDNAELGVSAGAHVTKASFSVEADVLGATLEEHRSKSAPLPNVGLYGSIDLFGPVALQANVDAFKMKAGNFKGTLLDGQLSVEARVHKNIGLGLGYRYAYYKVEAHKHDWRGKLTYDYYGPIAYVELAF